MSQQPPYPPYSQGGYPNPYQAYPQRRDNTTRNVLLIVGGVLVALCLGVGALGIWAIASIDSTFDSDFEGSEDDPLTVAEGEAFSIRGFDYDEGWSVTSDGLGGVEITGLRATNDRGDEDTASIDLAFQLYRDNELLATVDCLGGYSIPFGRSKTLDCSAFEPASGFDEIVVYDDSYYE